MSNYVRKEEDKSYIPHLREWEAKLDAMSWAERAALGDALARASEEATQEIDRDQARKRGESRWYDSVNRRYVNF